MKTRIFSLLILTWISFLTFSANAWLKVEHRISYDNNFQPTADIIFTNPESKIITAIQFVIVTKMRGSNMWDTSAYKYDKEMVNSTLAPKHFKVFHIPINLRKEYDFYDVVVERVRFSDGSIKEY